MKEKLILICIFFLAIFLRTWQLDKNPPGLYWDEVAIGYNAYSLTETGKDEYGNSWPLLFRSFEDFKLPGYIYTTAFFVKIFGLNEWAVRLPSALFGVLAILFSFFLVKELFPNHHFIFYFLFLIFFSISPWHLQFSRAGFEANGGLTMTIIGIYFLVKALKNPKFYFLSGIFFVLSLYFYYSNRIFLPLFLLSFLFFFKKRIFLFKKELFFALILSLFLFLPLGFNLFSSAGTNRVLQVSIFNNEEIKIKALKKRADEKFSFESFFPHHQYKEYFVTFVRNYFSHFSPGFLFFDGDPQERHSTRGMGMLYLWEIPFLIIGLNHLLKKENQLALKIIIPWFLFSPIAASFALPSPHALRSLIILPTFQIISALGVYETYLKLKKYPIIFNKMGILTFSFIVLFFFLLYQENYWRHSKKITALSWADGHKELFSYLNQNREFYDKIFITGRYWRPYIFALFYLKYPPEVYQKEGKHSHFDKYYFGHADYDTTDSYYNYDEVSLSKIRKEGRILLVLSPEEIQEGDNIIKKIYSISGKEVFILVKK